ncbi:MAG: T9SS type A sorting domain-containing protein [Cryomorphaceae bacterium]
MNSRILLFSVAGLAAIAMGWLSYSGSQGEVGNAYVPRSDINQVQGAEGAFEYLRSIKANIYTGEIEAEDEIAMRKALKAKNKNGQSKNLDVFWESMGPNNVGGRTRAVYPLPDNPTTIYAGGISGGMFRTTNDGTSWERLVGFNENLVVSAITKLGNGALYVATGHSREGFPTASGGSEFIGGGLFVSNDDGATWSMVSDFQPSLWNPNSDWANINMIKSDPNNDDLLWIGNDFGFYPYVHGDEDLGPQPSGLVGQNVQDFDISEDGQNFLVAMGPRVYVSEDFGQTFEVRNNGPFDVGGNSTIDVDIAPYDKNFMVASVATSGGFLKGIYISTTAGVTWNVAAPPSEGGQGSGPNPSPNVFAPFYNGLTAQGNYDNMITVVPGQPGGNHEVIMGGIRLYKYTSPVGTTPSIALWEGINANFASSPGAPPSPSYVHSDIHTAAWDSQGRLYIGSDGGIFRSNDNGETWNDINRDYTTTQYYAIAFSPQGQVLGGLQDNGSLWLSLNGATPQQARQFSGGDGFSCEISQEQPNFMFSTLYNGTVFRSADGGNSVNTMTDLDDVSNGGGNDFFTDIALHENVNNEFSQIFVDYSPFEGDPYLELFGEDENGNQIFELTANGDTIIGRVPAGTEIIIEADNADFMISKVLDEDLNYYSYFQREFEDEEVFILEDVGDTTTVQEKPQFMLAAALSNGVYLSRQPLKTNGTPQFYRIAGSENSAPNALEFSPDGDHLYIGYRNGALIRYSNLNSAWTEEQLDPSEDEYALTRTIIRAGAGAVTDIEVDYSQGRGTTSGQGSASPRVAISVGGYGGSDKILVSETGATAGGNGTFTNAWNVDSDLQGMPCYSVIMDVANPEVMMAGTEYGIWYTDNGGDDWTEANNGDMNRVPIHDLRQQKSPAWKVDNSGVVYAGSHGRGVFRTDYLLETSSVDHPDAAVSDLGNLFVFPNPLVDQGTIQFDLGQQNEVNVFIYTIDGRVVKSIPNQRIDVGEERQLRFDASDLPTGTYIVQLQAGDLTETSKFVKTSL